MKIIFICSSLEPGRDGVGDYIRRLSSELIRQGYIIAVIALNDKYIKDQIVENQQFEDIGIQVLRLPTVLPLKLRLKSAKKYIDEFNPDWLSLQFVIFGYHPKGLPLWLKELAFLGKGRQWHIMFHELWLGMETNATKKHFLWGKVQRLLIKRLVNTLKPKVIHTHTALYQYQVSKLGFNNQHLPLFGNIPLVNKNISSKVVNTLKQINSLKFVIFGHIHPNVPIKDFAGDIAVYASENELNASLTLIGRCGTEQEKWINEWSALGMSVTVLGEQPINYVSEILSTSSIGISTTPVVLLGKSGSVAAMHEHGLPIICVPAIWQPQAIKNLKPIDGVMAYKKGNLNAIFTEQLNYSAINNVSTISSQLITSLLNSV